MQTLPLVPVPYYVSPSQGELSARSFRLVTEGFSERQAAEMLSIANDAVQASGLSVHQEGAELPTLTLVLKPEFDACPPPGCNKPQRGEGYELQISDNITVTAASQAGLRNGLATLAQLAFHGPLPKVLIQDEPRYSWRGLSVDVARHWYGVPALYKLVDILAAYKLNTLHLHLTDDQGWRIEIPEYPALTQVSGRTQVGGYIEDGDKGYLSLAEFRALSNYAWDRGISVIPEIDLPGHINAALHAVPELNPDGVAAPPYFGTKVGFSQLRADNPATKPFLAAVLKTICENTPGSNYVHIGGDEVPNLPEAEYREIVEFARDTVIANHKDPLAWQDAAKVPGMPLQYWNPKDDSAPILAAAQRGEPIIMSPAHHAYLDIKHDAADPLGMTWGGALQPTSLEKARGWEPELILDGLDKSVIVGVEAAIWSETLNSFDDLLAMLFPRLPALAEIGWSSAESAADFIPRLQTHTPLWRHHKIPESAHNRVQAAGR